MFNVVNKNRKPIQNLQKKQCFALFGAKMQIESAIQFYDFVLLVYKKLVTSEPLMAYIKYDSLANITCNNM